MPLITLKGKPNETEKLSAIQQRKALNNKNHVVIYNGFQITEDCPIQDGDLLFIFKTVQFLMRIS